MKKEILNAWGAENAGELLGIAENKVEDALAVALIDLVLLLGDVLKEAVEKLARAGLLGHRHRGVLPGEIVRIGAAISRITASGLFALITTDLKRGKGGLFSYSGSRVLVDRHAHPDIFSIGFLDEPIIKN